MSDQSRGQFPRSSVTGSRPNFLHPGSFAVNWADRAIWVGDASGNAVRFSRKIEDWDQDKAYYPDDFVIVGADVWRSLATVPAGTSFIPGQWQRVSDAGRAEVGQPYASEVYSGGVVTFTPPNTIAVAAGSGVVIDNRDPARVLVTRVNWSGFSVPVTRLGSAWSLVGINAAGSFVHIPLSAFTPQWRRENIALAYVNWTPAGVVLGLRDASTRAGGDAEAFRDEYFLNGAAYRTSGARIKSVPGTRFLEHTAGEVFALGVRWRSAQLNPNTISVAARSPFPVTPVTATGAQAAPDTAIPTDVYDPDGTGTALPLPTGKTSIMYLVSTPDMATIYLQYGQTAYDSRADALNAVPDDYAALEKFAPESVLMLLAAVIVESGAASLDSAVILNAAAFGDPFAVVAAASSGSAEDTYLLDGSRALRGNMDAAGFSILNAVIDGMVSRIKPRRSTVTGFVPPDTGVDDFGEIAFNLTDRKLFIRDAAGQANLIIQGIAEHSTALVYAVGDLAIVGDVLYLCTTAVPVPGPFVPASWRALTGSSAGLAGAVVLAPGAAGRNRIVPTAAAAEGLIIDAPPSQTADLLSIPGTAASDTGKLAVDALGFPNKRFGASIWRQTQPTHTFAYRGQAAAFNGTSWVPANAATPTGKAVALVDEIIDANTIVLRSAGRIVDLQAAAFAGGVITPGATYYVSDTVAGQLTTVKPLTARVDPVLVAISATAGVVAIDNVTPVPPPSTTVGPTPPASPTVGQLWYDTGPSDTLFVWVSDGDGNRWAPAVVIPAFPPGTTVAATPPASPQVGQLWFSTVSPVGLYVWHASANGSRQWVQTSSGASP